MFKDQSLFEIFKLGGVSMSLLLLCSVVSIAIILERLIVMRRGGKVKRKEVLSAFVSALGGDAFALGALKGYLASVARTAWESRTKKPASREHDLERAVADEVSHLEKYLELLGLIGSLAVYIGLFGTVLGIIRAFQDIAVVGSGGVAVVVRGVSEALVATAAGLGVAIPAVAAHTLFLRRIDSAAREMQILANALTDELDAQNESKSSAKKPRSV